MENNRKQKIIKKTFLSLKELISFLKIDAQNQKKLLINPSSYSIKIPYRLAQKMQKNNLSDPLFLQFVPLKKEIQKEKETEEQKIKTKKAKKENNSKLNQSFQKDPLCDSSFLKGALLHKYQNRALILCSNHCAMHCSFCFRQHLEYESAVTALEDFSFELKHFQNS